MCSLCDVINIRALFGEDFLTLGKWFAQIDHSGSNDNKLVTVCTATCYIGIMYIDVVCLSVCLFVCLSVCLSTCMCTCI